MNKRLMVTLVDSSFNQLGFLRNRNNYRPMPELDRYDPELMVDDIGDRISTEQDSYS